MQKPLVVVVIPIFLSLVACAPVAPSAQPSPLPPTVPAFTVVTVTTARLVTPEPTRTMGVPYPGPSTATRTPPSSIPTLPFSLTAEWNKIEGQYVSFAYPPHWQPTLWAAEDEEGWNLGIPQVDSDNSLGFSNKVAFEEVFSNGRPRDIVAEAPVVIGNQPGIKWIRRGDNYVTYDYLTEGLAGAGTFGIHVTVAKPDMSLEQQLDLVVQTIIFTPPN